MVAGGCVMLIVPSIGWRRPAGGGGGYSFNMTAGDFAGVVFGYYPAASVGSIDVEPIAGQNLVQSIAVIPQGLSVVVFSGDLREFLSGFTVWVDGVEFNTINATGDWELVEGETGYKFGDGTEFTDGNTYFIEIK